MSIEDEIVDRVDRGMLVPLLPKAPGSTVLRAMFVGERLQSLLDSPEGDAGWEQRIGALRADLEVFVTAPWIDSKYLFLLWPAPQGVWEIRSVRDDPSIRVMGLFAKKDIFVSTNLALREELGTEWDSDMWRAAKTLARTVWRNVFFAYLPVITTIVSRVVTGAKSGRYYKARG